MENSLNSSTLSSLILESTERIRKNTSLIELSTSTPSPSVDTLGMIFELAMTAWVPYFTSFLLAFIIFVLRTICWTLVFIVLAIWWFQGYALYMPTNPDRSGERRHLKYNPRGTRFPSEMDLPFEEYFLQCSDGVMIHTWLIPQKDRKSAPTVIFFHGNAGNIGNRLYNAKCMYHYLRCNILLVEYRGFGNSQGAPSESGFQLDAITALNFITARPDLDPSRIFLFGRSLGGAVAVWLANQRPQQVRGLILENTFTSVCDMFFVLVARMTALGAFEGVLRVLLRFFMTSHWQSVKLMPDMRVPTLFISGLDDELVPPKHMQALHDEMHSDTYREFYGVPGGMHNTTYVDGSHTYWRTFSAFVDKMGK